MTRILTVDDAEELGMLIRTSLEPLAAKVDVAQSVKEAKNLMADYHYDLFIVDLHLPDGDGFSLVNYIRSQPNHTLSPILILSASNEIQSKVSALSLGADDYMCKPFHVLELRARVESKLKRAHQEAESLSNVSLGPIKLDSSRQVAIVEKSGEAIHLSNIEFRLLTTLARRHDWTFTRQQLLDLVWGGDINVNDRTVDTHVFSIRKKLGPLGNIIQSVQGIGYRAVSTPNEKQTSLFQEGKKH